jgi:hypothetical protein
LHISPVGEQQEAKSCSVGSQHKQAKFSSGCEGSKSPGEPETRSFGRATSPVIVKIVLQLCVPAVSPRKKKENICAPALAFVFAWHRIGAIAAYEKQR